MSLFWKIFMSFGIAMTLTLIGVVFVSFRLAERAFDQDGMQGRRQLISRAGSALEDGGEQGLKRWLEDNRQPSARTVLYVVTDAGQELLGRRVPERFIKLATQSSARALDGPRNFRPRRLTSRLIGPDGREYHLFFLRAPRTLFGVLNWPSTQIAVLLIAIVAAALTALFLARYLSGPIVELQRASRALAAGNLETRVRMPANRRHDEVGTLARDFDAMAEQLQALVAAKETLLRDVSHELRSPLARIRVALALAERHADQKSITHLRRIEHEAETLDELVGQVMTLTRLRAQRGAPPEELEIADIIADVVDNAEFEFPEASIRFDAQTRGTMRGDVGEIRSAIENVVRNALHYSASPGEVTLRLRAIAHAYEISVADTGPGVPEQDLDRIFEPFYRPDSSRSQQNGGQGIGLAITARVMQRHGGSARARNRPEGGLEILLTLPVAGSTDPQDA
jgi:signal transduction histidine kinase